MTQSQLAHAVVEFPAHQKINVQIEATWDHFGGRAHENFTQGLVLRSDGRLIESVGLPGQSLLRTYLPTVKGPEGVQVHYRFPNEEFAEGIAALGPHCHLALTWKHDWHLIHSRSKSLDWGLVARLPRPRAVREGWGIAVGNGGKIFVSDGSEQIHELDLRGLDRIFCMELPGQKIKFNWIRSVSVITQNNAVTGLNEMELLRKGPYRGHLAINVWTTSNIVLVDPNSGLIHGWIDFDPKRTPGSQEDVLNGIAEDNQGRLIVTGKNWRHLYRLRWQ